MTAKDVFQYIKEHEACSMAQIQLDLGIEYANLAYILDKLEGMGRIVCREDEQYVIASGIQQKKGDMQGLYLLDSFDTDFEIKNRYYALSKKERAQILDIIDKIHAGIPTREIINIYEDNKSDLDDDDRENLYWLVMRASRVVKTQLLGVFGKDWYNEHISDVDDFAYLSQDERDKYYAGCANPKIREKIIWIQCRSSLIGAYIYKFGISKLSKIMAFNPMDMLYTMHYIPPEDVIRLREELTFEEKIDLEMEYGSLFWLYGDYYFTGEFGCFPNGIESKLEYILSNYDGTDYDFGSKCNYDNVGIAELYHSIFDINSIPRYERNLICMFIKKAGTAWIQERVGACRDMHNVYMSLSSAEVKALKKIISKDDEEWICKHLDSTRNLFWLDKIVRDESEFDRINCEPIANWEEFDFDGDFGMNDERYSLSLLYPGEKKWLLPFVYVYGMKWLKARMGRCVNLSDVCLTITTLEKFMCAGWVDVEYREWYEKYIENIDSDF